MTLDELLALQPGTRFRWAPPDFPAYEGEVTANDDGSVTFQFLHDGRTESLARNHDDITEFAECCTIIAAEPPPEPMIIETQPDE
jgi:hypothetical protein